MVGKGTQSSLASKVALITGAAAGLGRATALEFARRGARLVAVDLDPDGMAATARAAAAMGHGIETVTADLAVEAEVARALAVTEERFGRLDILVNCAGILLRAGTPVHAFPTEAWQRVIDVNLTGTFLCVKHATPLLERSGGGVMLLLASGAGIKGGSYSVAYAASKGGVHGLALCARAQLLPLHIRLHVVIPDTMNTRMRVGATGEYAELRGESRERAEQDEYARLPGPERSAEFLADLVTEEGAQLMGEQLLVSVEEWQQHPGP